MNWPIALTAKEHHDDGVKLLRVRVWRNIAKPNRDEGSEAEVERRAIPGLHFVFLYFCISVFLYFCVQGEGREVVVECGAIT